MRYERSVSVASRLEDVIALVRCGWSSAPMLAARLGVSEQTIYRDIRILKRKVYAICWIKSSGHWAYELRGLPVGRKR